VSEAAPAVPPSGPHIMHVAAYRTWRALRKMPWPSRARARVPLAAYRRALAHFARWRESTYGASFEPASIISRDVRDYRSFQQSEVQSFSSTFSWPLISWNRLIMPH